ncbi:MAG: hypothetical protein AB7S75_22770 [Desulfococcaceae bacterium]
MKKPDELEKPENIINDVSYSKKRIFPVTGRCISVFMAGAMDKFLFYQTK